MASVSPFSFIDKESELTYLIIKFKIVRIKIKTAWATSVEFAINPPLIGFGSQVYLTFRSF